MCVCCSVMWCAVLGCGAVAACCARRENGKVAETKIKRCFAHCV